MSTIQGLVQTLTGAERRYQARTEARENAMRAINEGRVLEADSPDRVEKRLNRLRTNRHTAEELLSKGYGLSESAIMVMPNRVEPIALERVLGTYDFVSVSFLERGWVSSRATGRVNIRNSAGSTIGYGTGFMVSPRLMLTNNHVLESPGHAANSLIEFNYHIGLSGEPPQSVIFQLNPSEFFVTDQGLDYTLVAVQTRTPNSPELQPFGWVKLIEEEGKIIKGEFVNIVQHPNGEPKQLALRENQLVDVLDDFLHYHTDTAPGSSGSPVFNDEWEVVALHHSGVPERDIHGNILTKDGRVWRQWMGEHRINWVANEGVRISRIVKHIKAQGLSTNQSKLLSQMFELDQPILDFRTTPVLSSSGNGTGGGHLRPTSPGMALAAGSPTVGDDGSVTFTIPIQVNIQVPRATVMKAPNVATAGGTVDTAPQGSPEEQELSEALQEFERARTRVYYDQDQDRVSRDVYYTEIDCRTSPDALYRSLSKLVKGTHTRRLKYNPSTHVYPWVDLQPDLKLRSVYSSLIFEPDEFIREDFRIGQERAQAIQMFLATEGTFRPERLEQEIDMLEDLRPFNCEHVVPQSWFVKKEPMRGDLHHLFACESGCNSFRSNIAYYDFADFEEVVRGACGKREENKFEPSSGKGVVARATLYFLLRYPGQINDLEGEFDRDRLPILLQWHEHDPVSPYERHRNMAIHEKQGNRNPLIDFPEWASVINFNNGFA